MNKNQALRRAIALSVFSPDGGMPEDIDHVDPVGMGRKRYGEFDDSELRGLSHHLHMSLHAGEPWAVKLLEKATDS